MDYKFGDVDPTGIDVVSSWRTSAHVSSAGVGCNTLQAVDMDIQTDSNLSIETQTYDEDVERFVNIKDESHATELIAFLSRVQPVLEEEFGRSSKAFSSEAFAKLQIRGEQDKEHSAKRLFSCSVGANISGGAAPSSPTSASASASSSSGSTGEVNCCTSISWNVNGTLLAAGVGGREHDGWCNHRGAICLWNIYNPSRMEEKIEVPCCVTCLQFHPELPNLVAGGLFNGQVRVWDINEREDPEVATTKIDDTFHREPISQVRWVKAVGSKEYHLASVSGDGRLLFWSLSNSLQYPVSGYCLVPSRKYHGQGKTLNRFPVIGGTSMSFSKDGLSFAVGTEAGGVISGRVQTPSSSSSIAAGGTTVKDREFEWTITAHELLSRTPNATRYDVKRQVEKHCRLNGVKVIDLEHIFSSGLDATKLFPSAVQLAFQPHAGPVYGLEYSPFHRNLFVSCSTDSTICLFHSHRSEPVLTLEEGSHRYQFDISWSSARPLVFATCDEDGMVHLFDVDADRTGPVLSLEQGGKGVAVTATSFCGADSSLLASCDEAGMVHVWQLSDSLSVLGLSEASALDSLMA